MASRYWVGGTGNWDATTTNWSATSGGAGGASVPTSIDEVFFNSASNATAYTVTLTTAPVCRGISIAGPASGNLTFAGNAAWSIYGNIAIGGTGVTWTNTSAITFAATTTGWSILTNGVTLNNAITFNGVGGGWTLGTALTTSSTVTLTSGALDLNNNNLTCPSFFTSNSNTRSIAFGTGQIYLTSNGFIWSFNTATNLTITGSAVVNATYSGSVGTRIFAGYGTGTASINLNVTAGTDIVQIANYGFNNLNFTGFSGSFTQFPFLTGNLTLGAGMSVSSALTLTMSGTSGTQLITTNGVTIDAPITFNGVGGTFQLQDSLIAGSTRTVTLSAGTLDLNAQTASIGLFSSTGANVRSIAFNGGTTAVTGATYTVSGSNFTTSGSGTINMTSASSKTFAGGGKSYPTLNQGGAGTLIITGANTFANMTNTVQPCTITFPASTTTTVSNFNVNGTAGNLVTLNSSTPGTRFTLAKI